MSSKIELTDRTWNPIVGCSKVSPGCENCYAERMAARLSSIQIKKFADGKATDMGSYSKVISGSRSGKFVWFGKTAFVESALTKPLHWKKPRRIFVCSMGDLFHETVPFEWIDKIFAIILANYLLDNLGNSTFQILTKRSKRQLEYFTHRTPKEHIQAWAAAGDGYVSMKDEDTLFSEVVRSHCGHHWDEKGMAKDAYGDWQAVDNLWPLPNVWLGVTAEDQGRADERFPDLVNCPAAKRFVSCEPMLEEIDFKKVPIENWWCPPMSEHELLNNKHFDYATPDLVICGGESGPGARPMHPDWARSLRDQCKDAGVAFMFKQWGAYTPNGPGLVIENDVVFLKDGTLMEVKDIPDIGWQKYYVTPTDCVWMKRVGKKKAGRVLDGVVHDGE